MAFLHKLSILAALPALLSVALVLPGIAVADDTTAIKLVLKDHQFTPSEIHVPAGKPAILVIENADLTAEEFDSPALKAEKVIAPGQTGTIHLRPLAAGRYPFKGEFHEDTANGVVVAE